MANLLFGLMWYHDVDLDGDEGTLAARFKSSAVADNDDFLGINGKVDVLGLHFRSHGAGDCLSHFVCVEFDADVHESDSDN